MGVHPRTSTKTQAAFLGRTRTAPEVREAHSGSASANSLRPQTSVFLPAPEARGSGTHYAIAIRHQAAASNSEITPYVDGEQVATQQESNNVNQGNFANLPRLYPDVASRRARLFRQTGRRLDQLAIYNQPAQRFRRSFPALRVLRLEQAPTAAFTISRPIRRAPRNRA